MSLKEKMESLLNNQKLRVEIQKHAIEKSKIFKLNSIMDIWWKIIK